ncbi:MAG: hemolysin family protein [Gemmatimonadaceae bacterium]
MSAILIQVGIILLLLVLNGVFAMSELALVAARRTRLEHRAEKGDAGAAAALALAASPANFLATVQIGITLVGVMAGAFGGAGIAERLSVSFATLPALAPYSDVLALGIVVAAITYLSLIIGELVPKQIALANPERVAALVARPMGAVARLGSPLVRLLTGSTNLVFRAFGMRASVNAGLTELDIRAALEQGAESGVVEQAEHEIIENTFRLGDRQVGSLMTPRPDVPWLEADCDAREVLVRLARTPGQPLLVCDDEVDRVLGVADAEGLLMRCLAGDQFDLRAGLRQPLFVPVTMRALPLLEEFRRTREHVAVVLDEYGGMQGVVTVDDILEALVGDLPERGELEQPEIRRQPDGSWLVDGGTAIEELERELDLDPRPEEERRDFHTVAGFVISRLGRVPTEGEQVEGEGDGLRYQVVEMDGRRVATVRISPVASDDRPDGSP